MVAEFNTAFNLVMVLVLVLVLVLSCLTPSLMRTLVLVGLLLRGLLSAWQRLQTRCCCGGVNAARSSATADLFAVGGAGDPRASAGSSAACGEETGRLLEHDVQNIARHPAQRYFHTSTFSSWLDTHRVLRCCSNVHPQLYGVNLQERAGKKERRKSLL